jgi:MFS family permease
MKAAFRQPGFRLLFCGLLASMAGDSIMILVLAIWVKDLTGSSGAAGLTLFFLALPALAAPVFGVVVDRLRRRTVLTWGNFASALAVLPLLAVDGQDDVWIIYAVALLYGISFVVLPAALNGLLKEMLPEDLLIDANAALSTSKEAMRLVGPLIGAGLYTALGGGSVALVDASSFTVAGIVVAVLAVHEVAPERHEGHWKDEFLAGVRHILRDPVLLHTMLAIGIALLVVGFLESAVFAMIDAFDQPASYVGVIVSVQGVGAIAGGLCSSTIIRRTDEVAGVVLSLGLLAAGLMIAAVSPWLPVVFAGVVVLGFALPLLIVAFTTLLQKRTPGPLMGRVSTATDVVLGTPQSLSIAVGAVLVTTLGYRSIYWISAAVIVAAAGYLRLALRGTAPDALSMTGRGDRGELEEDLPQIESRSLDGQRDQ